MFSLIITIISIALVALLALATLYYGGDAFNQGRAGAEASRLINDGQQVQGAVQLAEANGNLAAGDDIAALVTKTYLSQAPASFASTSVVGGANAELALTTVSAEVCVEVNKRAIATDYDAADLTAQTSKPSTLYGCWMDGTDRTFFYKM